MPPTIDHPRRLLFYCLPGYGHVFPMLPLAAAARDAGHEVIFATGADAVPVVAGSGFTAHQVGISILDGFSEVSGGMPVLSIPEHLRRKFAHEIFTDLLPRRTIDDLTPLCAELAPDALIYGQWNQGVAVVSATTGIPAIEFRVSLAFPPGTEGRDGLPPGDDNRLALLAARGLPAPAEHRFLDIFPLSLQNPAMREDPRRLSMRPVAWADPNGAVPDVVRAPRSRPLVYLTLGTTPHDVEVLKTALAGLIKQDVDVLVALGRLDPEGLPTNDRVHLARWVDQAEVLRHADFVVHHGGSGTTLGTIAAGVPQLVLPQRADQFDNAEAVAASGIGRTLMPGEVTPTTVADAVAALPEHRSTAQAMRAEVEAMPTPAELLPQILALLPGRS